MGSAANFCWQRSPYRKIKHNFLLQGNNTKSALGSSAVTSATPRASLKKKADEKEEQMEHGMIILCHFAAGRAESKVLSRYVLHNN